MDKLCTAGVTRPQPINGPGDGEPEYLIPQEIYMRYITPVPLENNNVNDTPCQIDPSLLEANSTPPRGSQHPKPRPRIAREHTKNCGMATVGSAMVGLAAVGSALVGLAMIESAVAQPGNDAAQNAYQQLTHPEARCTRRTADDLAQQEARSTQAVGRRQRIKKVKIMS